MLPEAHTRRRCDTKEFERCTGFFLFWSIDDDKIPLMVCYRQSSSASQHGQRYDTLVVMKKTPNWSSVTTITMATCRRGGRGEERSRLQSNVCCRQTEHEFEEASPSKQIGCFDELGRERDAVIVRHRSSTKPATKFQKAHSSRRERKRKQIQNWSTTAQSFHKDKTRKLGDDDRDPVSSPRTEWLSEPCQER